MGTAVGQSATTDARESRQTSNVDPPRSALIMSHEPDVADALSSLDLSASVQGTTASASTVSLAVAVAAAPALLPLHVELPLEIVEAIIGETGDHQDLARWCLVSRSCLRAAGPLLWREVRFSSDERLLRVLKIHQEVSLRPFSSTPCV